MKTFTHSPLLFLFISKDSGKVQCPVSPAFFLFFFFLINLSLIPSFLFLVLFLSLFVWSQVDWDCSTHRLHLCRGLRLSTAKECPYMTQNNMMVRLQFKSFGEYGVLLYCHRSQVHSGPEWSYLWVKLNCLTFKLWVNKWLTLSWIVRNRTVWSFNCV